MLQTNQCPDGVVRRMGHLAPVRPIGLRRYMVSAVNRPLFSRQQVIDLLMSPTRTRSAGLFDQSWIKKGDQKSHGSCNGFALGSAASKIRFKAGFNDGLILSGAYLYSKMNGGSDNGSSLADDVAVLTTWGAPSVDVVTADMIYKRLQPSNADQLAADHKGLVMYFAETQAEIDDALACGFTVVNCLYAGNGYSGFRPSNENAVLPVYKGPPNHANHNDDAIWTGSQMLYRNVNNWNVTWGWQGWSWATFGTYAGALSQEPFVVIASMSEVEA